MIYKSNRLLHVLILIYIHIFYVCESTIVFHRHENGKHQLLKYYGRSIVISNL